MSDKKKSTYYLPPEIVREMRIEAARLEISYPSEFILFLWEHYKENKKDTSIIWRDGKFIVNFDIPRPDKEEE